MKKLLTSLVFLTVLSGCSSTADTASNAQPAVNCDMPSSKKLADAVAQSRRTLSKAQCHNRFDQHFEQLLAVGAGEPGTKNKLIFRDYLVFAQHESIIAKRQMQLIFTEHFSETFVSLSASQSVCQAGKNLDRVAMAMDKELVKKKLGLQQILGDNQTYYSAARQRESAVLILAATAQACGA